MVGGEEDRGGGEPGETVVGEMNGKGRRVGAGNGKHEIQGLGGGGEDAAEHVEFWGKEGLVERRG